VCGSRLLELSGKALAGSSLREIAMPTLRQLMQRTRLPVHVALLEREQVTIIAQIAPPGTRLLTSLGQRFEVHCTALGKAIAAYLPEARLTEILRARALTPHNERTIISPKKFADELALSKQRGYAVDDEEDAIGYRCLAAPILDAGGAPVAAVSVMGTNYADLCGQCGFSWRRIDQGRRSNCRVLTRRHREQRGGRNDRIICGSAVDLLRSLVAQLVTDE
jgi:DNA-binding IclR family transcriptional regulator